MPSALPTLPTSVWALGFECLEFSPGQGREVRQERGGAGHCPRVGFGTKPPSGISAAGTGRPWLGGCASPSSSRAIFSLEQGEIRESALVIK